MTGIGCDSGALETKVVVLKDETVVAYDITPTESRPAEAAQRLTEKLLSDLRIPLDEIEYYASTGWGGKFVPFDHSDENPALSISRGVYWVVPTAKTIVDAGGVSVMAVRLSEEGTPLEYRINDKCASGSGRFVEIVAEALELKIDEVGDLSLSVPVKERVNITNQCAVFGESEVIGYVNRGIAASRIMAGVCYSVGTGFSTIAKRLGIKKDCVLIGGVAKNKAVVSAFEENTGIQLTAPGEFDPQIIGAVGAALCARDRKEESYNDG
ncbi:MAG: hypothetical protein HF978_07675 [Desulfobacteraceae bacterium]|nr:hypothetical protein [Desulfobacteraceae bacterium]MBC2755408.1 hypothetical protein [Desulfobacteraceae bacterium]MBC2764152.1 hypothetical protein [ANME-2 cluster archaeon]